MHQNSTNKFILKDNMKKIFIQAEDFWIILFFVVFSETNTLLHKFSCKNIT